MEVIQQIDPRVRGDSEAGCGGRHNENDSIEVCLCSIGSSSSELPQGLLCYERADVGKGQPVKT